MRLKSVVLKEDFKVNTTEQLLAEIAALKSQLKQQEAAALNESEKEIQLELNHIEQRLKMKRAELESCKQLASKQAEESAPTFGLR